MTDYQTYLYSFQLQLLSLELPSPTAKTFVLQWRKGQKLTRSQPILSKTRLTHLSETLKLCLKLSRNSHGDYLKKHTTLSLMQGNQLDLVQVSAGRIDLAEVMISNRGDLVISMFPEPVKIICKLRFQFVTELKHFRFGNQEIEESQEDTKQTQIAPQQEPSTSIANDQQKLILRKELQDLNYLNQKFRTDREKLILKVRELEQEFQDKEKQLLRETRNTKAFYGQKIKLREGVYEEEIEKIVFISNERIAECQQHITKFQDESDELKNKLKNKQGEVIRLREELIKVHGEKAELESVNRVLEEDRDSKHKNNLELIQKYELRIKAIHQQTSRKAEQLSELRENEKTQILIVQEEERTNLLGEIRKYQGESNEKSRVIEEYQKRLKMLEEDVEKKNKMISRIDDMLSIRKDEILTHQFQKVEISHKLESMLSENKSIEQTLNHQMLIAQKERKELAETILKFQSLTVTYKLEKENFNEEREAFKAAESVYQEEIAMLKDEQKKLELEVEEIHDREIQLENEVDRLHHQNNEAKDMFDNEAKVVQRYEEDLENLRNLFDEKEMQLKLKDREIDQKGNEIERLHNDLKKVMISKEDLESEIKKLEMINKTTEELYNNKIQRETDHLSQYNDMSKKHHEGELEIERLKSEIINKDNQIAKLERKHGELTAKLKMRKREHSEESNDSSIFKSNISASLSPKEGNKISAIEYAHIKAQMELYKKETEKKDLLLQQLNQSIAEKNSKIDEMEERISKDVMESRIKEDNKLVERELIELSKKNEKINRMLSRYEERVENVMKEVLEIIDSSGGSKSKSLIHKLSNDFNDLQVHITQIREENEKSNRLKKDGLGRTSNFPGVEMDRELQLQVEDLRTEVREKNQEIRHLHDQVEKMKRNLRARSESDIEEDMPPQVRGRNRSKTKYQMVESGRETFGPRRVEEDYEESVENLKRHRAEKEMAMKESQMMKSSQMMDTRIQALNHQLKLKGAKEQEITQELKQRILTNKELEEEIRVLKSQNFSTQEEARKLQHSLQALERDHSDLQRNREADIRNNNSNEIALLSRENTNLKESEAKLRNELERTKDEYKDKYIRYSEHKDIISELDRAIKEKGKEIEFVRREVNEVTQGKNKLELITKSQESELEEVKKKLSKLQDSQSILLQEKESELKGVRRKIISFERQEEELEGKIESLQDKVKLVGVESERTAEEFNRRHINQLKEINLLKQEHEVLNQENKVIKKRNQQLAKANNQMEQRLVGAGKTQEEQRRKIEKVSKELEDRGEEVEKCRHQIRKLGEEIKRLEMSIEESHKEKKELQEDNNKLVKNLDSQLGELRRVTKELERSKNQVNETEHDSISTTKSVRLQMERLQEEKRKLEKVEEEQGLEIKRLNSKLKQTEEESAEQIASNSKVYGERMSTALGQIEMIRKAVKEAELEIADYEVENRDLGEEIERLNGKVNHLEGEKDRLIVNLETTLDDIEKKKEEIDRLKKEKFDLELSSARAQSEAHTSQEDLQKLQHKLQSISETNKSLIDTVESVQSQLRSIKIQYTQLMTEYSAVEPYQSKYKHLEKEHKDLVSMNEEVLTELRHKQECIYTKQDMENYEGSVKARYQKEMELHSQQLMKEFSQNYEVKQEHVEAQIVELLNQNTFFRGDLEKYKQENSILINENNHLLQFRERAGILEKEVVASQSLVAQLETQLGRLSSANQQSTSTHSSLHAHIEELSSSITKLRSANQELESSKSYLYSEVTKLESRVSEQNQSQQELNNKFLQLQFQNARLKENEMFEKSAYQKRIQELLQDEQGNLRSAEDSYIEKIHLYNNEMGKLKNILSELKYLVEEKSNTIEELNNEYDLLENELIVLKEEYQSYKLRSNEEKEIASLELFKMTTKLRESEDQSTLKFRRMEEELNRISQQLILATNNPNYNTNYNSNYNKFNNSRVSERDEDKSSKKYEEKIKLKDRTIEELKLQNMNLEAEVFKIQEERQFGREGQTLIELRAEVSRLKVELEKYEDSRRDTNTSVEISQLNDQISTLKKKLAKSKANEELLTEEIEEIRLKYDSLSAEMIYYKGLESANKELKLKYEQICDELRGSRLERSTTSEAQNQIELLENEKDDLERKVEEMQTIILRLGGQRESLSTRPIRSFMDQ